MITILSFFKHDKQTALVANSADIIAKIYKIQLRLQEPQVSMLSSSADSNERSQSLRRTCGTFHHRSALQEALEVPPLHYGSFENRKVGRHCKLGNSPCEKNTVSLMIVLSVVGRCCLFISLDDVIYFCIALCIKSHLNISKASIHSE